MKLKLVMSFFCLFFLTKAYVDFDASMGCKMRFGFNDPHDEAWFSFFRYLYKTNIHYLDIDDPLIPQIIHMVWLGSSIPREFYEFIRSWEYYHADWRLYIWTDEQVKRLPLINQELYDQAINYGQKADILRYELLYRFGGFYVDMDFRCLKSIEPLRSYKFVIGISNVGTVDLGIGFIGSVPGNPILHEVIYSMKQTSITSLVDILHMTGNMHFLRTFMRVAPLYSERLITLPASYLYPLPNTARLLAREQQDKFIKPESFAIHYWACSWAKKEAFVSSKERSADIG